MPKRVVHDAGVADLENAQAILRKLLEVDFDGADAYRRQLAVADVVRHETGCAIRVDRSRAKAASFSEQTPGDVIAEATGHGKLWLMLHVYEGYLDDLELVFADSFPDPTTVRPLPR